MGLPGHCIQGVKVTVEKVGIGRQGLYKIVFFLARRRRRRGRDFLSFTPALSSYSLGFAWPLPLKSPWKKRGEGHDFLLKEGEGETLSAPVH